MVLNDVHRRANFTSSRLYWDHNSSKSHGVFKVESILKIYTAHGAIESLYALSTGVLSGNIYVTDRLVQNPVYYFQIAASKCNHVIFRTYTHSNRSGLAKWFKRYDNFDIISNNESFASLDIDIKLENAVKLDGTYESIHFQYMQFSEFTCLVKIKLEDARRMELEFLIKHINICPKEKMFQIETGPVLFVEPDWLKHRNNNLQNVLVPSFIHFNKLNQAAFSIDFPYCVRKSFGRGKPLIKSIACDIQLLVNKT